MNSNLVNQSVFELLQFLRLVVRGLPDIVAWSLRAALLGFFLRCLNFLLESLLIVIENIAHDLASLVV